MKIVEVTIRGYENLKRSAFETLAEITKAMKPEVIVQNMNAYLGAHPFNSAFESALVDLAIEAGHSMLTEKSKKGNDVIVETNSAFLKRVKFTVTQDEAQEIVEGLAWPPVSKPRGPRVDAATKLAEQKVDAALKGGKSLDDIAAKLQDKGFAAELVDGSETRDTVVAAYAAYLRAED